MNHQKGLANVVLVVAIVILVGVVGYFAFVKKSEPMAQQSPPTQTSHPTKTPTPTPEDETANWQTYKNEQDGVQIKHPQSWYAYGDKSSFANFDAPKRFITQTRTDEKWEQVTVNGYAGTKITNTTTNKVTDYVFERNGKLYDFNASQAHLFDTILPTLKFF